MINKFSQNEEEEASEDISPKFDEMELNAADDSRQDISSITLKLRQNSIASSVHSEVNSAYESDNEDDEEEKIRKGEFLISYLREVVMSYRPFYL